MTSAGTYADPGHLSDAFRHLAEDKGAQPGAIVETGHLKRHSLAAHHFVEVMGHRVRFDHGRGEWFLWRGHRWHRDRDAGVRRLWLEVLASRYEDALAIADSDSRDRAVAAIQAAGATDGAIVSGLRIAASMVPVTLTGSEWDPDPWLLGCENGVVDLRSGTLRDGRPEDMATRSTGLSFDADAPCDRWLRMLAEVFAGDEELAAWAQRLIGASLVGVSKEVVGIHHGAGNNGKSVFFGQLARSVGEYGIEVAVDTLLASKRQAGAPTPDLMRLRGARLAFTSEPDQRARISGGTLKRLATIDKLSGRDLNRGQQEWVPTHTVHLATNHLPEVDDPSDGLWRRMALVPWAVRFLKAGDAGDGPREDPALPAALAQESEGVLAWIVRGAVAFVTSGLHPFPKAVQAATDAYRADEDQLRGFLALLAASVDRGAVTSGELHAAYDRWAEREGLTKAQRLTSRAFGRLFSERHKQLPWPVERGLVGGRTVYRGLRILDEEPDGATGGSGGSDEPSTASSHEGAHEDEASDMGDEPTRPTSPDADWYDEQQAERANDDSAEVAR
jgi:putative DNA primase/helicase